MGTYQTFKTDETVEKEGIALDMGDAGLFHVARAGGANKKFAKVLESKYRPYRRQEQAGTLDPAVAERILIEVFAETVILDWKNVTDENGDEMECSVENAKKLLTDLPELFSAIREEAMKAANFRAYEVEEDLKN